MKVTLSQAILSKLTGTYQIRRLGPGTVVKGQAFTYLQRELRADGWRGVTYSNVARLCDNSNGQLGFDRGRGRRGFHGGKTNWGGDSDVVWIVASARKITDEQLGVEEKTAFDRMMDDANIEDDKVTAASTIIRAEVALGCKFTDGQLSDLLADNHTDWSLDYIKRIIAELKPVPTT